MYVCVGLAEGVCACAGVLDTVSMVSYRFKRYILIVCLF